MQIQQKLLNIGQTNSDPELNSARRLFNSAAAILSVTCFIYSGLFWFFGSFSLGLFILINAFLYAFSLYLNHINRFKIARLLFIHVFNFGTLYVLRNIGYDSGLSYLFFFLISASSFIIVSREFWLRIYSILLPIALLFITELTKGSIQPTFDIPTPLRIATIATILGMFIFVETFLYIQHKNNIYQLQIARLEAEKLANTKGQFLSMVSHEIRTPINAINGLNHILKTDNPEEMADHLSLLNESCGQLTNLLDDILDYSQLDQSSPIPLKMNIFNLKELLEPLIADYQMKAQSKNIEFIIEQDKRIKGNFQFDEKRLQQVLGHLLENAIKFTNSGYVKLSILRMDGGEMVNWI